MAAQYILAWVMVNCNWQINNKAYIKETWRVDPYRDTIVININNANESSSLQILGKVMKR